MIQYQDIKKLQYFSASKYSYTLIGYQEAHIYDDSQTDRNAGMWIKQMVCMEKSV